MPAVRVRHRPRGRTTVAQTVKHGICPALPLVHLKREITLIKPHWYGELLIVAVDFEGFHGAAGGANLPENSIACAV